MDHLPARAGGIVTEEGMHMGDKGPGSKSKGKKKKAPKK
jgi:hypothetical protein